LVGGGEKKRDAIPSQRARDRRRESPEDMHRNLMENLVPPKKRLPASKKGGKKKRGEDAGTRAARPIEEKKWPPGWERTGEKKKQKCATCHAGEEKGESCLQKSNVP